MFHRILFTAAFGLLFVLPLRAQPPDNFREIFSDDYDRAAHFLKKEKWMDDSIRAHRLVSKEIFAVVFPEIIRFNSFQNKIETYTLETLYVQYGKAYANFSVGEFQIKPSFAENIEVDFLKAFGASELSKSFQIIASDTLSTEDARLKRVKRLKSKTGMINYLCMYFRVMNLRYPNWKNPEEKIKFMASAYNCGYRKSKIEIESFVNKKFYHTGFGIASKKYAYAHIALYFFLQP